MAEHTTARIAVIGGSGLYELLDDPQVVEVDTPYAQGSVFVALGSLGGETIAFLARHGADHTIPPHQVNYRANIWALASLGVRAILGSAAVGSLTPDLPADTFVVPDQLIDRTRGRADTFFDGPDVQHVSFADPFCPTLSAALADTLTALGETHAATGTTVVIAGPRFSSRAESRAWRLLGGDIVNMTQYPEAVLAAELGVGYASLAFVTDMDAGASAAESVDVAVVTRRLVDALPRIAATLTGAIERIPVDYTPSTSVGAEAIDAVLRQSTT